LRDLCGLCGKQSLATPALTFKYILCQIFILKQIIYFCIREAGIKHFFIPSQRFITTRSTMFTLTVKEAIFGSGNTTNLQVPLRDGRLTLTELITAKVTAKVYAINEDLAVKEASGYFLSPEEKLLNREVVEQRGKKYRDHLTALQLDAEKAVYEALAGFQTNAFFVLIDGEQKADLAEEIELTDQTQVHFIRLMPLIGG